MNHLHRRIHFSLNVLLF